MTRNTTITNSLPLSNTVKVTELDLATSINNKDYFLLTNANNSTKVEYNLLLTKITNDFIQKDSDFRINQTTEKIYKNEQDIESLTAANITINTNITLLLTTTNNILLSTANLCSYIEDKIESDIINNTTTINDLTADVTSILNDITDLNNKIIIATDSKPGLIQLGYNYDSDLPTWFPINTDSNGNAYAVVTGTGGGGGDVPADLVERVNNLASVSSFYVNLSNRTSIPNTNSDDIKTIKSNIQELYDLSSVEITEEVLELIEDVNFGFDDINYLSSVLSNYYETIYPVGSIYMTITNTDPSKLFAGTTWIQIQNNYVLQATNNNTVQTNSTNLAIAKTGDSTYTLNTYTVYMWRRTA